MADFSARKRKTHDEHGASDSAVTTVQKDKKGQWNVKRTQEPTSEELPVAKVGAIRATK